MKKNPVFVSIVFGVVFVMVMPFQSVWAVDTFTMAFFYSPDKEVLFRFAELLYTDAFQRLGMEFTYQVYPPKRCGVMANHGYVDGEPGRVENYDLAFPNLIRVGETVVEFKLAAFADDPSIHLNGWESLQDTTYYVETIIGTQIVEKHLPQVVDSDHLSVVPTIEQALKRLLAGRTDIFIHNEEIVLSVLQTEEFRGSKIVKVGHMQDVDVYPFLHKKHAAIAPKLAEVLRQLKKERALEKYRMQALEEVGSSR